MKLFEVPDVTKQKTRNDAWSKKIGGKHIGGPRELWGDYWRRFNIMQIPMLGEDEYFRTATEIAEVAANEEEFEKLFIKRNKQREKELMDLVDDITEAIGWDKARFPCRAARRAAINANRTGCFEYFVSLLRGNVLGWEADSARGDMPNNATAHVGEDAQKQNDEETQRPDDEEVQGSSDYEDWIEYEIPFGHEGPLSPYSPNCETQFWGDTDHFYAREDLEAYIEAKTEFEEEQEYREKRAKDIQEIDSSDEEDMSHHEYERRLLKSPIRHTSTSHSSFSAHGVSNGDAVEKQSTPTNSSHIWKYQRSGSPVTAASPNASSIKQKTLGNSRKRVRFHDDEDDREHKRQRTQSPVPTLPSDAPFTQQSAVKSSMKRRGSDEVEDDEDDDDDDDKGNQGRKRQEIEDITSDPTPPASSSTQKSAMEI
ncbi:hypothetical protein Trisim1_010742 [Trichoderma cf. simile WF8]